MSKVGQKNTGPELKLRKSLHRRGFRYRLNVKGLPGSPDLVFPKYKAVIFVHGCFWHAHEGCKFATKPLTREKFWKDKFEANRERDQRNYYALESLGWRVLVVWECSIKKKEVNELDRLISRVVKWLETKRSFGEIGGTEEKRYKA